MDDDVVMGLSGRHFPKVSAVLEGYRKDVPAGGYPRIVADEGGTVQGMLLQGVDAVSLRAFDLYEDEGRLYQRTPVMVRVGGEPTPAVTYVGLPVLPKNCA